MGTLQGGDQKVADAISLGARKTAMTIVLALRMICSDWNRDPSNATAGVQMRLCRLDACALCDTVPLVVTPQQRSLCARTVWIARLLRRICNALKCRDWYSTGCRRASTSAR